MSRRRGGNRPHLVQRDTTGHSGQRSPSPVAAIVRAGYSFTWRGVKHTLPPSQEGAQRIPGAVLMDLIPDPAAGALQLGVAILKASDVHPDTMAALREMPAPEFAKHLGRWLERGGVNLPEAERSST